MKINNKVFETWAKWTLGMVVSSIVTIGKFPLDLTSSDWKQVANSLWIALLPVLIKWLNPKDEMTLTVKK